MSIPELKLIVTDLDGTLLGAGGALVEENAAALKEAAQKGVQIAIASGRLPSVCSRIALNMGLDACHILGMNGAHTLEKPFGKTLTCHAFPDALRAACLQILAREGCAYNLYTDTGIFTNQPLSAQEQTRFRSHFAGANCQVVIAPDAEQYAKNSKTLKFLVKQTNGVAGYERARAQISALEGVYLTTSKADNFEVMQQGLGKAEAVQALAKTLNIPLECVAAFGDFDNDLPMLALCGLSVAMGNATEKAKQAARFVTKENTKAGVAYAVRLLLSGKTEELVSARFALPD